MDEKQYRELGQLTNDKTLWKQNIPYVASLLEKQSPKITAKELWLLGEMDFCASNEKSFSGTPFPWIFSRIYWLGCVMSSDG